MKKILGLDLGTNSIGWSLLHADDQWAPKELVDCGSRIFIKSVEDKTPTPKNQARRQARLARRLIQRRARRRKRLENYLIKLGFLPTELRTSTDRESVLNKIGDPYLLRAKALDVKLEPHELGRVLLHLVSRRGFQSNRKTLFSDMLDDPDAQALLEEKEEEEGSEKDQSEQAKEASEFKQAIGLLQQEITQNGCRTLGEYLSKLPASERKRNRRTGREMYKHEFDEICKVQSTYHPGLTEEIQEEIWIVIFHQRPLRIPKKAVGFCSLEKKNRRCHAARLEFQRFRYLQDLNYLRYDDEHVDTMTGEVTGLGLVPSDSHRVEIVQALEQQRNVSWAAIRKIMKLPRNVKFNLEQTSKTKGLPGNQTACVSRGVLGAQWDQLTSKQQHDLVEDLISFEKKPALKKRLVDHWGFEPRTALKLMTANLPDGYANLSLKAIRKLLPFMEQNKRYDEARKAAGYTYEVQKEQVFCDRLPAPPLIRNPIVQKEQVFCDRLPAPPLIRNPIVQKALFEVRRLVNAVIATYGKPDAIRIELPRDLTMNNAQKQALLKQQAANQKANEEAEQQYENIRNANTHLHLPERPGGDDRLRYRLWMEQDEKCPYTGVTISLTQLFSAAVDIDHILPYSRTLDDSYLNKVVVFATANRQKGNRTPYEAFAGNVEQWEQIVQRAQGLHRRKFQNVMQKEVGALDGFINSQLTDTAYISREVHRYVASLGCDVSVTKGIITAWLRRQWGLNSLLGSEVKNRSDHRHHAIDATVVALTDRPLYRHIAHAAERGRDYSVDDPWENFRGDLQQRIARMIVAHAPLRKIVGALHEETGYGIQPNGAGGNRVVYRKPLDDKFDRKQIEKVLDPHLGELLKDHLERFDGKAEVAFSEENRPRYSPGQAPIRHVRIIASENFNENSHLTVRDRFGKPYRYHPLGNNHHVEIFRHRQNGKIDSVFVSAWEAARRARRDRKSLFRSEDHGPEWEHLMTLCINDLVRVCDSEDERDVYRVQSIDPDGKRLVLRHHTAATIENDSQKLRKSIAVLVQQGNMRPLQVNSLGHLCCHDQASR